MKLNTVLKVLFALVPVNRRFRNSLHLREKELLSGTISLNIVCDINTLKMSVSFDKNFEKSIILQCCFLVTLERKYCFYVSQLRKWKWPKSGVLQKLRHNPCRPNPEYRGRWYIFLFPHISLVPQKDEIFLRHHKEMWK